MLNPGREAKSRTQGQCQIPLLVRGEDEVNGENQEQADVVEADILTITAEVLTMCQPQADASHHFPLSLVLGVSRPLNLMICQNSQDSIPGYVCG